MDKTNKTHKSILLALAMALAISFVMPAPAYALKYEYKQYTVKKGDTLWSITKRELVDAYQWPLVWMENKRINDPDLIYPGQVVLIPIGIARPEALEPPVEAPAELPVETPVEPPVETPAEMPVEAPEPVEPAKKAPVRDMSSRTITKFQVEPIVSREVILDSGYITLYAPDSGMVTGSPTGRMSFGIRDEIYLKTEIPVEKGQKFYVVRKVSRVTHPSSVKIDMGWSIKVIGTIVTLESGTRDIKAKVIESFDSIVPDDLLDHYSDITLPFKTPSPRMPDISGVVLKANYKRLMTGIRDVVFLDKGSNDGIVLGDVFVTLLPDTDDSVNGVLQIINVRDKTSLALILKSKREVVRGDAFREYMQDL